MVLENQHITELCWGTWLTTMNSFSRKQIVPFSLMDQHFIYYWNPDMDKWKTLYSSRLKLHYRYVKFCKVCMIYRSREIYKLWGSCISKSGKILLKQAFTIQENLHLGKNNPLYGNLYLLCTQQYHQAIQWDSVCI